MEDESCTLVGVFFPELLEGGDLVVVEEIGAAQIEVLRRQAREDTADVLAKLTVAGKELDEQEAARRYSGSRGTRRR